MKDLIVLLGEGERETSEGARWLPGPFSPVFQRARDSKP